jgi:hypothetical protein
VTKPVTRIAPKVRLAPTTETMMSRAETDAYMRAIRENRLQDALLIAMRAQLNERGK